MNWLNIRSLAERSIVIVGDERLGVCRIGTLVTVDPNEIREEAAGFGLEIIQEDNNVLAVINCGNIHPLVPLVVL